MTQEEPVVAVEAVLSSNCDIRRYRFQKLTSEHVVRQAAQNLVRPHLITRTARWLADGEMAEGAQSNTSGKYQLYSFGIVLVCNDISWLASYGKVIDLSSAYDRVTS